MRILALYFPKLPMALSAGATRAEARTGLAQRRRMGLEPRRECPVVLMQGYGEDAIVSAVSNEAALHGVLAGMTAGEARRRCREAQFRPDNAGACLDALERIATVLAARITPFVEVGARNALLLGIDELPDRETTRLAGGAARLARQWCGTEVRAGVADDPQAAIEAARAARRHPLVCPRMDVTAEIGPLDLHARIRVATRIPVRGGEGVAAAHFRQLGRRVDLVLEGRSASFREVRLVVLAPGQSAKEWRRCVRTPQHDTRALIADLTEATCAETFPVGTEIQITVERLGPDVRVKPLLPANGRMPRAAVA